jgi:hypothetical protein
VGNNLDSMEGGEGGFLFIFFFFMVLLWMQVLVLRLSFSPLLCESRKVSTPNVEGLSDQAGKCGKLQR